MSSFDDTSNTMRYVDVATYYKSVGFDIDDADLGNPNIQIKLSKFCKKIRNSKSSLQKN